MRMEKCSLRDACEFYDTSFCHPECSGYTNSIITEYPHRCGDYEIYKKRGDFCLYYKDKDEYIGDVVFCPTCGKRCL